VTKDINSGNKPPSNHLPANKLACQPAEKKTSLYDLNASHSTLTRKDYKKIPGGTGVEQRKY
jgi:hypothetical protein